MITIAEILLYGLVTWRITTLLTVEEGPFDIFVRFRELIGVDYDEFSNCVGTWILPRIFCCHWCASMWVALAIAWWSPHEWYWGLAYSTLSILFQKRIMDG